MLGEHYSLIEKSWEKSKKVEKSIEKSTVIIGRAGRALLSDWLTYLTHYSADGIAALLAPATLLNYLLPILFDGKVMPVEEDCPKHFVASPVRKRCPSS